MLADDLLVLVDNSRKARRITAVSRKVAQLDIQPGMALRYAQALVSELTVLPVNPPQYRASLEGLVDTLRTFSDRIEIAYKGWGSGNEKMEFSVQCSRSNLNPAVAFLDIGHLKPKNVYQLGHQLQNALRLSQFEAKIGIAPNRFTSWVAALAAQDGRLVLVNKGEEKWTLTCHPVTLLPLDDKAQRRLWWLGIHTLGDYAALPATAIRPRFGEPGDKAYQLAQGIDPTPIRRLVRQREITRSLEFENTVSDGQVIGEALKSLVGELVATLGSTGETARRVRLTIGLDHRGACELEKPLRRRSNSNMQFYDAVRKLLDRAKVAVPISGISVTLIDIVRVEAQQLELFPAMQLVEARQAVLEDLVARYGERFYTASVIDQKALFPENQIEFTPVEIA